jgi:hypothetical protein
MDLTPDEVADFILSQLYLAKAQSVAMSQPARAAAEGLIKELDAYTHEGQKHQARRLSKELKEMLETGTSTEEITKTIATWEVWKHDKELTKGRVEDVVRGLKKPTSPLEI